MTTNALDVNENVTSLECVTTLVLVTLLERLEWVISQGRVKSGRQWAIDAGLSSGYLGSLTTRLRSDPKADIRRDEMVRLARSANVSLVWLATGQGSPDDVEGAPERRWVERDERYPNRGRAVEMARELGLLEGAIEEVQSLMLHSEHDPSVRDWLEQIQRRDRQLRDPFHDATREERPLTDEDAEATRPKMPRRRGPKR